jgi:PKD repeat protein
MTVPVSVTMTAVDGNLDSPVEATHAVIDTTGLNEGEHTIFVRGQDTDGNWGVISAVFLQVMNSVTAPVAGFTVTTPILLGDSAVFTNTSTGDNLQFLWDFGDGLTSTDINPSHTYTITGSFTVTLTATNTLGSDVATAVVQVVHGDPPPDLLLYIPIIHSYKTEDS